MKVGAILKAAAAAALLLAPLSAQDMRNAAPAKDRNTPAQPMLQAEANRAQGMPPPPVVMAPVPVPVLVPKVEPALPSVRARPPLLVLRDADTTIYLLGTFHAMRTEVVWFEGAVREAFDKSSEVMLEIVPPAGSGMAELMVRLATNASRVKIADLLPEDRRPAYAAALKATGFPAPLFENLDPWFVAIALNGAQLRGKRFRADQGVDLILLREARRLNKTVGGLVTPEVQLGYLDGLPQQVQLRYLILTLDTLTELAPITERIFAAWIAGDLEALGRLSHESFGDINELEKVLLDDRNLLWSDWVVKRMDRPGTAMVAVGAAHLVGGRSLPAILRERGFQVERIQY